MHRSLSWSPTIALSWLWGLGFFYAFDVTLSYGLAGFAAFALPNALGLYLFGRVLGRHRSPEALFAAVSGRYAGWMVAYQGLAVAITLFGFGAHLAVPILGPQAAVPAMVAIALLGCAVGQAAGPAGLARLHALALPAGAALGLVALCALLATTPQVPAKGLGAIDARLVGLALPSLAGFLLGPWLDVQQWQRAVEIRRRGGDPERAYAGGALLFLGLLCLNAGIALACGAPAGRPVVGGPADLEGAPAAAAAGSALASAALLAWGTLAMATTLDSFQAATRWFLGEAAGRSKAPLLALVPAGLASSPLPWLALALAGAGWAWSAGLSHVHLMAPFATLLLGAGACLAAEAWGFAVRPAHTLLLLLGGLSAMAFAAGYAGPAPAALWASTVVALAPALASIRPRGPARGSEAAVAASNENSPAIPGPRAGAAAAIAGPAVQASHWTDDGWFAIRVVPTYDDTNSVGNIYFANYIRWVGKAREMFFIEIMPEFDLKTTAWYVLTRSFSHDFRRETSEFDPVTVRIRISRYNRKFVTLEHEIHSERRGLLGKGEQKLMFVDAKDYGLIDLPGEIMKAFMPQFQRANRAA